MTVARHLTTGRRGEDIAEKYLRANGYRILGRNNRFGHDELDIIAFDPATAMMVFVEVKTRRRSSVAYPIRSAVTAHKRRCLRRAIAQWVSANQYDGPGRLDVICVRGENVEEHLLDLGSDYT